jgi:chemotaxis protein MotA
MDFASIIGLVVCLVILVIVMIMDGGSPAELFSHPSAVLLIFGGSLTSTMITTSMKTVLLLPKLLGKVFIAQKFDEEETIEALVKMADKARREGLLALEEEARSVTDPFLQSGLMMVVDGVDPQQVHAILESKIEQMRERHRAGYGFFAAAGGFAPTFGIIGTVMGLISVLKQLDDPSKLAKSIAAAFLATLWGLLSSNLIYLPMGAKLKQRSETEAHFRYMQMTGILAIHSGENPQIVREKLSVFVPPSKSKAKGKEEADKGGAQKPSGAPQKAKA